MADRWSAVGQWLISLCSTFGRWLVNVWSTVEPSLVNVWSTPGQRLVNSWSTFAQPLVNVCSTIDLAGRAGALLAHCSADGPPAVGGTSHRPPPPLHPARWGRAAPLTPPLSPHRLRSPRALCSAASPPQPAPCSPTSRRRRSSRWRGGCSACQVRPAASGWGWVPGGGLYEPTLPHLSCLPRRR